MTFDGERTQYVLTPGQRRYLGLKRVLDIVLSLVLLALTGVPMLLVALVQKLESPSEPVLFRQQRIGRGETMFTVVKFRTMRTHTARYASAPQGPEDMTRLGRFLRASSIDELPQLFQVLSGRMSLIGPRPLVPWEETVHALRRAYGVYQLRPGITGWAQINGRDLVSDEDKAALDRAYLERVCFGMDWKIFWRTIGKVAVREGYLENGGGNEEQKDRRTDG